ncbi:NAD(P)/FAD-dependent oxidoreductase [Natrialbaceae archaeon AArc-T1-2]|uniref:NAD(P)/FAD-dependent oxidoreductase n=1 Tax=Natrialbaceae archaeon AArc-T1-2 TaxID=3053904 RepID=UPI00255AA16E|nr:NAD(P)/FAD-dependent oxidoreductase [Natrialbaceae archaeon AArc-T1-2]WIV68097.1 NAD(P)/FAD-dependent oxidoreductase [Natrialbaceae archaeon AArc-T1-2]
MTSELDVIVAGGGLAGLVAARHLAAGGATVAVFERRDEIGGRVRTVERDGYQFDRGFQVLFTAYPAVRRELDLEALDLRTFSPGACIARPGHRSTLSDPLREPTALPATLFNPDLTIGDKLRVLRLRRRLTASDPSSIFDGPDTSIETYLREQGFSKQFRENFVAPFYGGITLDRSLSTSKRVFEYTFRALATGEVGVPAEGMAAIPRQLSRRAREAGATIETDATVTSVSANGQTATVTVAGEKRTADAVVVATDPPTAAELTGLESVPTEARACVTQYYALSEGTDLGTDGRLLLNAGEAGPNQIVPHSEVAPEYAPEDATLVSATFLGDRAESDRELAELTAEALASWYPERLFDRIELVHTERVPFAQFAQPPGVHDDLPDVRDPAGPVYLAGDYTRWSSIQGAIESGRLAARAVLEDR